MLRGLLISDYYSRVPTAIDNLIDARSVEPDARLLESVLQSSGFERSPRLRTLFLYLWEHRDKQVSEYAIAVDALQRGQNFDSRTDATVRVQIARLRKLLKRYYAEEGADSGVRLVIPLGTHKIDWLIVPARNPPREQLETDLKLVAEESVDETPAPLPAVTGVTSPRFQGFERSILLVLVAIILVLFPCTVWLGIALIQRKDGGLMSENQKLSLFWKDLLEDGRATRIVLPTPVFFTWEHEGRPSGFMVRDTSVNESAELENSSSLAQLERQLGKPTAFEHYTVASDTVAAVELMQFFNRYGTQNQVSTSGKSPQQITDYENIVAFGSTTDLNAYKADLKRLSYRLGPNEKYIIDTHESGDSSHRFAASSEPGSRLVVPGLISLIPRGPNGCWMLLVQGAQTAALVSYLVSDNGVREIEQARAAHNHAAYFEMVVLSEVNEGHPIQSRLVSFRPFMEPGVQEARK